MPSNKLRVEIPFRLKKRSDGGRDAVEARVPADVRDYLGCGADDRLIFEDASEENLRRAALYGDFLIVRRATRPGELRQVGGVKVLKPAAPPPAVTPDPEPEPPAPASLLGSLEEDVRRRLGGRR